MSFCCQTSSLCVHLFILELNWHKNQNDNCTVSLCHICVMSNLIHVFQLTQFHTFLQRCGSLDIIDEIILDVLNKTPGTRLDIFNEWGVTKISSHLCQNKTVYFLPCLLQQVQIFLTRCQDDIQPSCLKQNWMFLASHMNNFQLVPSWQSWKFKGKSEQFPALC